jgi:hypothetical protein
MPKEAKRPTAVFHFRKYRSIGAFIGKIRGIVKDIETHSSYFATPKPTLASVRSRIDDLVTAQSHTQTRIIGSVSTRDIKYQLVVKDVHALKRYVQETADVAPSLELATAIISSSGFSLRAYNARRKPILNAKSKPGSGIALLTAHSAGKRASYNWQKSSDGMRWTDLDPTMQAFTTVIGLIAGSKVYFRYRAITKDGPHKWCDPIFIFVP